MQVYNNMESLCKVIQICHKITNRLQKTASENIADNTAVACEAIVENIEIASEALKQTMA